MPFLSLNLNALAEQLVKVDLAKLLFIEPDLVPPEMVHLLSQLIYLQKFYKNLYELIGECHVAKSLGTNGLCTLTVRYFGLAITWQRKDSVILLYG